MDEIWLNFAYALILTKSNGIIMHQIAKLNITIMALDYARISFPLNILRI